MYVCMNKYFLTVSRKLKRQKERLCQTVIRKYSKDCNAYTLDSSAAFRPLWTEGDILAWANDSASSLWEFIGNSTDSNTTALLNNITNSDETTTPLPQVSR